MQESVRVSIVIPTFDNLPILQQCLERWRRFSLNSAHTLEVIVIEDGCRDGTRAYLAVMANSEWGQRCLRWFHEDDAHELICTNRGLSEARGSLILAWQDDMLLNAGWFVQEVVQTFDKYRDLGLLSFSRGLDCMPLEDSIERWEDLHDPRRLRSTVGPRLLNWFRLQEVDIVIRPWAVRRACIEKVGRLDESFRPTEWDEADLCFRIRQAGWRVGTHAYERVGAYTHLGSSTLTVSDQYKKKVLRNGLIFHGRWDHAIRIAQSRDRRSWRRRMSLEGWLSTIKRMLHFASARSRSRYPRFLQGKCTKLNNP